MALSAAAPRVSLRQGAKPSANSARVARVYRVVKARAQNTEAETNNVEAIPVVASSSAPAVAPVEFQLLGPTQEAINGRSAMLGMVAAFIAEASSHHSVFSQIAGKYVELELVEKPFGISALGFGAIVAIVTMATLAPRFIADVKLGEKSFGPFTPGLETSLGRLAMLGFSGLLIVEAVKGSSLL